MDSEKYKSGHAQMAAAARLHNQESENIPQRHPSRIPLWRHFVDLGRRFRSLFSRRELSIRLLRLEKSQHTGDEPGLVLIQIDGLSRTQFERALKNKRMPYLKRLIEREGHRIETMYSGQPATTPAVQAELFYGKKAAVPAFSFRETATGKLVEMVEGDPALRREKSVAEAGQGLLAGGSAYSNIYSGGAAEAHFCASVMGWGNFLKNASLPRFLLVLSWNIMSLIRIATLLLVEGAVAIADAFRGVFAGRSFWHEIKFIPTRVAVCVLLRELIAIGAEIDVTRGLPIVQLNFLGYDEQAHRRDPRSAFAHWSLKQIDRSIRRVCEAAFQSTRRDYQVWVYSDHGQETVTPYVQLTGKTLPDVVHELFGETGQPVKRLSSSSIETLRASWLGGGMLQKLLPKLGMEQVLYSSGVPIVADKGALAHLYWPQELSHVEQERIALELTQKYEIPLVFAVKDAETVLAWKGDRQYHLPNDRVEIFGESHPFLEAVTEDFMDVCRHPEAGTFVLCGWNRHGTSVSFVTESGAHAGPGPEETCAFVLFPPEVRVTGRNQKFLRPGDLRQTALQYLHREPSQPASAPSTRAEQTIRVMTYNVHSCIGLEGKLSPRRIARVIAQSQPDIVALQELDVGRANTGKIDQAHAIAQALGMEFHFAPTIHIEEEQYGNAILSRFPMELVKSELLPTPDLRQAESRGAIWVKIAVGAGGFLQLINTHLGLSTKERRGQLETLLGPEWLAHPDFSEPALFCGDLNAGPGSETYRRITEQLVDLQTRLANQRPRKTWFSKFPLRRIDHIFSQGDLTVESILVPQSQLARRASDHLPLCVDLKLGDFSINH